MTMPNYTAWVISSRAGAFGSRVWVNWSLRFLEGRDRKFEVGRQLPAMSTQVYLPGVYLDDQERDGQ